VIWVGVVAIIVLLIGLSGSSGERRRWNGLKAGAATFAGVDKAYRDAYYAAREEKRRALR
jgi:hypothetical protein